MITIELVPGISFRRSSLNGKTFEPEAGFKDCPDDSVVLQPDEAVPVGSRFTSVASFMAVNQIE
jgi:hypothetical protein